jgi:hypothetical protein
MMGLKNDNLPAGWAEALAESEADLMAGNIVSADIVRQELRDSIAAQEGKLMGSRKLDMNSHR